MKKLLLLVLCATCLLVLLAGLALLWWLRPAAQDWQQALRIGPVTLHVDTGKGLALLSHPDVAPLLDGSRLQTRAGTWQVSARRGQAIELTCEPCLLAHRALGPVPLHLARVQVSLQRQGQGNYAGTLRFDNALHSIQVPWTGHVDSRGATLLAGVQAMPVAAALAVFGSDIAEVRQASVTGRLSFETSLQLPAGRIDTRLTLDAFTVTGLGTEQLLNVGLPLGCGTQARTALGGWLPVAVIAAEDQLFRSHTGYDLGQITAAVRSNQIGTALSGASTLTQQLARLLYTGAERSPRRKLRELLYAVEMERTLGKARILQLYLALAPWGDGVCGAESAARRYLGKPAGKLTPAEAAWLASLLTNADARLQQQALAGAIDGVRTARILQDMRPMSYRRREDALKEMASLQPPVLQQLRAATSPPAPAAPVPPPRPSAAAPGSAGMPPVLALAHPH